MGRGFVADADDLDGEPWSPELLDYLASDFVKNGYDIKRLIAEIVESNGLNLGHGANADTVAEYWAKISDFTGAKHYTMGGEQTQKFMERLQEKPVVA